MANGLGLSFLVIFLENVEVNVAPVGRYDTDALTELIELDTADFVPRIKRLGNLVQGVDVMDL